MSEHYAPLNNCLIFPMAAKSKTKSTLAGVFAANNAGNTAAETTDKKPTTLRWTMERAATEFQINPRTLRQRLTAAAIAAGPDGRYSTKEIASAVFGDIQGERLRKTREEADNLALRNAEMRGELVSVTLVKQMVSEIILANKQTVLASQLEQEGKNEILANLEALGGIAWDKVNKKK